MVGSEAQAERTLVEFSEGIERLPGGFFRSTPVRILGS